MFNGGDRVVCRDDDTGEWILGEIAGYIPKKDQLSTCLSIWGASEVKTAILRYKVLDVDRESGGRFVGYQFSLNFSSSKGCRIFRTLILSEKSILPLAVDRNIEEGTKVLALWPCDDSTCFYPATVVAFLRRVGDTSVQFAFGLPFILPPFDRDNMLASILFISTRT